MERKFLPLYEGTSLWDALNTIENDFRQKEGRYSYVSVEAGGGGSFLIRLGGNITKKYTMRNPRAFVYR